VWRLRPAGISFLHHFDRKTPTICIPKNKQQLVLNLLLCCWCVCCFLSGNFLSSFFSHVFATVGIKKLLTIAAHDCASQWGTSEEYMHVFIDNRVNSIKWFIKVMNITVHFIVNGWILDILTIYINIKAKKNIVNIMLYKHNSKYVLHIVLPIF
jgi:hypothetical protein